ncbi:MAG: hypothetical protein AAF655_18340 [Bacteroidota bacterium]
MKTKLPKHIIILLSLGLGLLISLGGVGMLSQRLLDAYQQYQDDQLPLRKITEAEALSLSNQVELAQLTQRANIYQPHKVEVRSHLQFVDYLSKACANQHVKLVSMPKETAKNIENYIISEEQFSIQGSFRNILNLIYQVEFQDRIGRLSYLTIERKVIRSLGKQRQILIADISLKRVENQQKL